MEMDKKSLIETNPYLLDSHKRREMFEMTVYTSTGIEGVKLNRSELSELKAPPTLPTRAKARRGSVTSSE
jgi:hypothetical protein